MVLGVLRTAAARAGTGLRRRLDPRASVTGKFAVAAVVAIVIAIAVVGVGVWRATRTLATTEAEADLLFRGGVFAVAVLASAIVVAFGLVERSVVRGLRDLDRETRRAAETGRYETAFEPTRTDEVGQLAWSVAELRDQLASQVDTVESLNRELAATATEQTRTLAAVEEGDLTERMDEETGIPQFDALATRFNETMERTETMVAEVRAFSRSVVDAADEATADATKARAHTDEVTAATASISEGVGRQRDRLSETVAAVEDLVDRAESVADSAETVARKSEAAREATSEGASAATDALDALGDIEDRTEGSVAAVESLGETVEAVAGMADRLRDLTEQTEHLTMNAELEAKKAAGDGSMTHLSQQIRDLSSDTEAAAEAIEEGLASVAEDTEAAIAEIERTHAAVDRGTDTIGDALGAFEAVERVVADTADDAAAIDEATAVQTDRAEAVGSSVDAVRDIGDETAREAASAAQTAREQQAAIESIERRVDWLADGADRLETALGRFTTREAEPPGRVPTEAGQ